MSDVCEIGLTASNLCRLTVTQRRADTSAATAQRGVLVRMRRPRLGYTSCNGPDRRYAAAYTESQLGMMTQPVQGLFLMKDAR